MALRGVHCLEHLLLGEIELLGDVRNRRRAPQTGRQLGQRLLDLEDSLLDVAGHADRPTPVPEVPLQLAEDGRDGEGGERRAAPGVEAVYGLDQAQARDLEQVVEGLGATGISRGEPPRERHEALDQLRAQGGCRTLCVAPQQHFLARQVLCHAGRRVVRDPGHSANLIGSLPTGLLRVRLIFGLPWRRPRGSPPPVESVSVPPPPNGLAAPSPRSDRAGTGGRSPGGGTPATEGAAHRYRVVLTPSQTQLTSTEAPSGQGPLWRGRHRVAETHGPASAHRRRGGRRAGARPPTALAALPAGGRGRMPSVSPLEDRHPDGLRRGAEALSRAAGGRTARRSRGPRGASLRG